MLLLALALLAFCVGHVFCQTSITLWEFGADRLLGGSTTLPLQPIGTAGLATTYIYEVADSVVTKTTEGTIDVDISNPTSRTIVVSASGWFEPFSVNTIQCHFVGSTSGECFDSSTTASGTPTPHVVALASTTPVTTSVPSDTTSRVPAFTLTSSSSAPSAPTSVSPTTTTSVSDVSQSSRTPSVGAIVGGSIAGFLVLCGVIFWIFRRKRAQKVVDLERSISGQPNRFPSNRLPQAEHSSDLLLHSQGDHGNVREMQLHEKARLEELMQSLQMATATAVQDNNSHEENLVLKSKLADISERLRRLEEQGWVNEPLPGYA